MKIKKDHILCFCALALIMVLALLNDINSLSWIETNIYNWLGFGLFLISVFQICGTVKHKYLMIILILIKHTAAIIACAIIGLICLSVTGGGTVRLYFAGGINLAVSAICIALVLIEIKTTKTSDVWTEK